MTEPTPNRPLWEIVRDLGAFAVVHGLLQRRLIALLLRAIADWLVPEMEPEDIPLEEQIAWVASRNLRQRLLAEADRAEAP
jgi:hypothetical protein